MHKLILRPKRTSKADVANIHTALRTLNHKVEKAELILKNMGSSTAKSIKEFQKKHKLPATGKLNKKTVDAINEELFDAHHSHSKTRTAKIHDLLERLSITIPKEEKQKRVVGPKTRKAIKDFQKKIGVKADGKIKESLVEALQEKVVAKKYTTKNQRGQLHKILQKVNAIANLEIEIAPKELKEKKMGASSKKLIKAFQEKYKLPVTGKVDKATWDKLNSVATSKGKFVKKLKTQSADKLGTVDKTLRLNMISPQVSQLQTALSFLGYKVSEKEYNTQTFGKTTIKAVLALQKEKGLAQTGHFDTATRKVVNEIITTANPGAIAKHRYRIRGSVRNELWQRKNNMVIKVFTKTLDGESEQLLAAKKTFLNGFFDIAYDAPTNPINGKILENFHLVVRLYAFGNQEKPLATQIQYNVNPVHWVNFTESRNEDGGKEYNGKYAGDPDFKIARTLLKKAIGSLSIANLQETPNNKQISLLSLQTGLSTDDIMRQVLSRLIAKSVQNKGLLNAEVFYAFIRQNLPADLPGDLLRGTSEWETIDQLTERAVSGIAFLEDSLQQQALDNAISQNLVSQKVKINRNAILAALKKLRTDFTLTKPILVGNAKLKSLLDIASITDQENCTAVANVFIASKGMNTTFWDEIKAFEAQIGANAIINFKTTVEIANMCINHIPTVEFLKNKTGPDKKFKQASDIAKLDRDGIITLINENRKQVPANMPGNINEKIGHFAAAIKARSELVYPAVSLVATAQRINPNVLPKIDKVAQFIDAQKQLNFREENLDKYLKDNPQINVDATTKASLKVVQRIHKLTTNPLAGAVLIDQKMHSSMQIYFMGKERVTNVMAEKKVEEKQIHRLFEASKMQYMNVLARITDFRREMYRDTPAAIIPHTYSAAEIQEALGDIPDLETLFGSLDYCECEHCKSLYGPAAYLTDMLRFLKSHPATDSTKTVKDILFERRPDIGNIKLNCENTNTPLPYIDLVCEILENNLIGTKDFVYQSTLSQKELRAIPENILPKAYEKLADADFPMNGAFNLGQEETRTYLNYLRVPRYELMETFQDKTKPAAKVLDDTISIAAEYFNLSWKEKDIILTARPAAVHQKKYWGLNTLPSSLGVSVFMQRSKLSYYEVLELLMVRFVNDPDPLTQKSVIERKLETCDTAQQSINNLTRGKYDLMHRFIRLWRKSGWEMWELDLLLRNPKIGNDKIDGNALVQLKLFKQLQEKIKLPFETALALYEYINREIRVEPEKQDVIIQPLYNTLFQNISVTNPIDTNFRAIANLDDKMQPIDPSLPFDPLILVSSIELKMNANGYNPVPVILSALAISQNDFGLLVGKTDKHLSVNSLSTLFRYVYLARGLKLSIPDLLRLLEVTNTADPFADLQTTLDCLENLSDIKSSGVSLLQLNYVLNYKPDSPVGLRDESIAQLIEGLRRILEDSRNKIDFLNQLISFDADALATMTDADNIMKSVSTLQGALTSSKIEVSGDDVSPEEIKYITEFKKENLNASDVVANRTTLVANIKKIQTSATKLLAGAVTQKQNQIKAQIASSFSITTEQAAVLLTKLVLSTGIGTLLENLENENLIKKIEIDGELEYKKIERGTFGSHFDIYTLLHKSALLVSKMKIETVDLEFFISNHLALRSLNFSALPFNAAMTPTQHANWRNLYLFLNFKSKFSEPENVSIRSILKLGMDTSSTKLEIKSEISALTKWDEDDTHLANLSAIETGLGIRHTVTSPDYSKAEVYARLLKCFGQMKLTGVDANTMFDWTVIKKNEMPEPDGVTIDSTKIDSTIAKQTRQAIKSKYEHYAWLTKITPLQDDLREKKRKALVDYHIDYSQRATGNLTFGTTSMINPKWEDSNSLFKYFLIDVEMSACQLTSRIKQALSSVQLFVQRCFLNLENNYVIVTQGEKEDKSSPNAWSQWKWMKNYRIWEANRKIFFYPENWLEPELRDDKSPFFKELENELMQNEVTKENVETAFLSYLHKVDEVSHLKVCGLYHQMEDLNPDEAGYETNIVHVIGRTNALPNSYYYRFYDMNYGTWSAWEKIEVDIVGNQVLPVVYNRKLHLFWLEFMEKPMKATKVPAANATTGPTDAPEPLKVLEVQLGWTVKKTAGWAPKKISEQKLIHPWERPHFSYHLKPYYLSKFNELYLDIYLSTAKEFNDTKFYDPNKKYNPVGIDLDTSNPWAPTYTIKESLKNPTYLTANRFNETYLPWHSSSFIFNGEVKDLKLKGLGGSYTYSNGTTVWEEDSYDYVHDNFGETGNAIKELEPIEFGPRIRLPNGMHYNNNQLVNNKVHSKNDAALRILEYNYTTGNENTIDLLRNASSPFELVITQQDLQFNASNSEGRPFFYQDNSRAFFIKPEWLTRMQNYQEVSYFSGKYRFLPFYHPYTMLFIREFNKAGIDGLLNLKIQAEPKSFAPPNKFKFSDYSPQSQAIVDSTAQKDIVDFSFGGSYAMYNWELFFHAPLMVACRLMQNQKFEDAMTWFHYIFNPTNIEGTSTPERYWVTKPFQEYNSTVYRKQRIESILSNLQLKKNEDQLKAWRNNPFKPHVIARYRPVAYQKNVVMKYLDNLIAWGDMLFKRDTIESINEASLLYMLAYEILGDWPQKVPTVKHEELTFNDLETKLDDFGNARVDVLVEDTLLPITAVPIDSGAEPIPKLDMLFYFCIPNNDFITKYWDTVEDRLFKIRNCMNISGIVRQLPLFEPPIDPALLVKAAAAGIDLSSVLDDMAAATPFYRFRIVLQKAIEFCNEVKALGEKLVNALEKKDIEYLSLMRSQHEIQLLEAVKGIRKKQIEEAKEQKKVLEKTKAVTQERHDYYANIEKINMKEQLNLDKLGESQRYQGHSQLQKTIAGALALIPEFHVGTEGFGGTPEIVMQLGGSALSKSNNIIADIFNIFAGIASYEANRASILGGYERRFDDWKLQERLAKKELDSIEKQITAAEIRQAIAELELKNHDTQIENAKTVDNYMRNKFSNDQLYSWMITQISTVYFQAYQLAFDMAKRAEKCYRYELGITDSNIVQFGYWDSLKKGLLSGDKLMNDIRRLDAEYLNQNKREFEITKHISLAQIAPLSLITLKETGKCTLSLPEWLFDMDYPGHYMRRIKNVSISIPCIVGPYTSINCTLSLLKNETRMDATLEDGAYAKKVDVNDPRFKTMFGTISSITTSHAQNDNGMFELNFYDERYLPFEGAGIISDWQIDLPKENNHFDFASLSDVILHVSYTSRNGGGQFTTKASEEVDLKLPDGTARLLSLKHEFSTEWHKFLNPVEGADQELVIDLNAQHFPFFIRGKLNDFKIKKIDLFVESKEEPTPNYIANIKVTNANAMNNIAVDAASNFDSVAHVSKNLTANALGTIALKIKINTPDNDFKSLTDEQLENIFMLLQLGN